MINTEEIQAIVSRSIEKVWNPVNQVFIDEEIQNREGIYQYFQKPRAPPQHQYNN